MGEKMDNPSAFPATKMVHWPSGPIAACEAHAGKLVGLAQVMGYYISIVPIIGDGLECANCRNEAQRSAK